MHEFSSTRALSINSISLFGRHTSHVHVHVHVHESVHFHIFVWLEHWLMFHSFPLSWIVSLVDHGSCHTLQISACFDEFWLIPFSCPTMNFDGRLTAPGGRWPVVSQWHRTQTDHRAVTVGERRATGGRRCVVVAWINLFFSSCLCRAFVSCRSTWTFDVNVLRITWRTIPVLCCWS